MTGRSRPVPGRSQQKAPKRTDDANMITTGKYAIVRGRNERLIMSSQVYPVMAFYDKEWHNYAKELNNYGKESNNLYPPLPPIPPIPSPAKESKGNKRKVEESTENQRKCLLFCFFPLKERGNDV